jgi:hypothetical protein
VRVNRILDILWQQLISAAWHGKCAKCNSIYLCSGHHIIKRRFHYVRWVAANGILLCFTCHRWAEEHELDFFAWLKVRYPKMYEWYEDNRIPITKRYAAWEMKELARSMRKLIKEITASS